jgi:hypothetical protein
MTESDVLGRAEKLPVDLSQKGKRSRRLTEADKHAAAGNEKSSVRSKQRRAWK